MTNEKSVIIPKYVHRFVDRHGKDRCYFRMIGMPMLPLPTDVNSEQFRAAYEWALGSRLDAKKPRKRGDRSIPPKDRAAIMTLIQSFAGENRVYFITHGKTMKIGTARNVANRFRALRAACPYELTLRGSVPGSHEVEREIHRMFKPERRKGEWFVMSDRLNAFVAECLDLPENRIAA